MLASILASDTMRTVITGAGFFAGASCALALRSNDDDTRLPPAVQGSIVAAKGVLLHCNGAVPIHVRTTT